MNPQPKNKKRKKVPVDWTGFEVPKKAVKLTGHAYYKFKKELLERDRYICQNCKKKFHHAELTVQHKIKRSILRLDTLENCETWCIYCHINER